MLCKVKSLYLVLFIVTLVISGAAQVYIKSTFGKWSGVRNSSGLAGVQVGEKLVRDVDFGGSRGPATGISFKIVPGDLSDHFDPRSKEIGLSEEQVERLREGFRAITERASANRKAERRAYMQFLRALRQDPVDPEVLTQRRADFEQAVLQRHRLHVDRVVGIREVLDHEQWEVLRRVAPQAIQIGVFDPIHPVAVQITDGTPIPATPQTETVKLD